MESVLLVYKTKTGFTKKYVDWIVEECPCKTITLEKAKEIEVNDYEIIIYGAGMHAGHIVGLKEFKKIVDFHNKKVIIFATGAAPYSDDIVSKIRGYNLTGIENEVVFFYFESGLSYENMGFVDKTIMKIYSKLLEPKSNKTELEEGISTAILTSYDHSKKEYIKPLTTFLNQFLSEY